MARPERYLADGEELVLRLRPHGRVLLRPFGVLVAVAAVGGAVAGAIRGQPARAPLDGVLLGVGGAVVLWFVLRPFLLWWSTVYVLSTRQVLLVRGLLARTARHLPLHRIDSLSVDRDLIDRLLGCGRLTVRSTGDADPLVLLDVPRVRAVEWVLTTLLDAHATGELGDELGDDLDSMDLTDRYGDGDVDEDEDWTDLDVDPDLEGKSGARRARRRWR